MDGQGVEAAGLSRDLGVALRAGQMEESRIQEEKPEGDLSSRGGKKTVAGEWAG